jgi:SAM-dependent methyltransferase
MKGRRPDGSEGDFFRFVDEYHALIRKHIPGEFHYEYDSRLYMLPVHAHLEKVLASLRPGAHVLDLGCGRGHYSAYLAMRGLKVTGIEVKSPKAGDDFLHNQDPTVIRKYPRLLAEASRTYGFKFSYFNGRDLAFRDGAFDAVLFYATFEHVPVQDIMHLTEEAFRVTQPGGWAFIFRCPSALAWKEHLTRRLGLGAHEKLYAKKEILGLLRGAGWKLESFDRSDFFPVHINPVQAWVNRLTLPLLWVEGALKWTPLRLFFHHFEIAARRPS